MYRCRCPEVPARLLPSPADRPGPIPFRQQDQSRACLQAWRPYGARLGWSTSAKQVTSALAPFAMAISVAGIGVPWVAVDRHGRRVGRGRGVRRDPLRLGIVEGTCRSDMRVVAHIASARPSPRCPISAKRKSFPVPTHDLRSLDQFRIAREAARRQGRNNPSVMRLRAIQRKTEFVVLIAVPDCRTSHLRRTRCSNLFKGLKEVIFLSWESRHRDRVSVKRSILQVSVVSGPRNQPSLR